MPFNFRLNLQSVFRRLGIQSDARLPQLNDQVQMTMLVTDLSRLIPAPIEPRGFAGVNVNPAAGEIAVCQLRALSPGGIFVEQIILRGANPGVAQNYQIDITTTDLGLPVAANINIGGTQIDSIFTAGSVLVPPGGPTLPSPTTSTQAVITAGIFVPNQAFFAMRAVGLVARLDVALIYRELPAIEEVG